MNKWEGKKAILGVRISTHYVQGVMKQEKLPFSNFQNNNSY